MKKTKSKTKPVPVVEKYIVSVKIFGKLFKEKGETIKEALENLAVPNAKGKSVLIVEKGLARKERILFPFQTFRLFSGHGIAREVAIKNTALLFEGM